MSPSHSTAGAPALPPLGPPHWEVDAYDRATLPESVLQFGTGMLLRALPVALVDAANREGQRCGRVVIVQSTRNGAASELSAQDGLFTLAERGVEHGRPIERLQLVGAVSRALVATEQWQEIRDVAASTELRVIVSNVTEVGFRLSPADRNPRRPAADAAPESFPGKLTDLLYHRFRILADGPTLYVIPTELVDDNGPCLAAMVRDVALEVDDLDDFHGWLDARVRFCSSLVDRITTGSPLAELQCELERRAGYRDTLLTVAEPYALWAIECDPEELRGAFPVAIPHQRDGAGEPHVIVAPDIAFYRERKIRLLNGLHSATAPLARLGGLTLVREAVQHDSFAPFLQRALFAEIAPSVPAPAERLREFGVSVIDRFRNPWLDHRWSVIAGNQTAKMRLRLVPSVEAYVARFGAVPEALSLAFAAYLRHARCLSTQSETQGTGWWNGAEYPIADADLRAILQHWDAADPTRRPEQIDPGILRCVAKRALADENLWGCDLTALPGFLDATVSWMERLERDGVLCALGALAAHPVTVQ